jgi:hypothetical protein
MAVRNFVLALQAWHSVIVGRHNRHSWQVGIEGIASRHCPQVLQAFQAVIAFLGGIALQAWQAVIAVMADIAGNHCRQSILFCVHYLVTRSVEFLTCWSY